MASEKEKPNGNVGGAATTMVTFKARVGISGPGYRLDAGKTGEVPKQFAEIHVKDGHGKIVKAGN